MFINKVNNNKREADAYTIMTLETEEMAARHPIDIISIIFRRVHFDSFLCSC